jgi:hypothetical protein
MPSKLNKKYLNLELFNLAGLSVNDQYKDKARGILINFKVKFFKLIYLSIKGLFLKIPKFQIEFERKITCYKNQRG